MWKERGKPGEVQPKSGENKAKMAADAGSALWPVCLESVDHFPTSCLQMLSLLTASTLALGWATALGHQNLSCLCSESQKQFYNEGRGA